MFRGPSLVPKARGVMRGQMYHSPGRSPDPLLVLCWQGVEEASPKEEGFYGGQGWRRGRSRRKKGGLMT